MLTDFGLTISRQDARLTADGTVIGTPGYLPPEVVAGGAVPDARHDLYAVGRLARTLLTGLEPSISPDPAGRSPGQPDVDFTDDALRAAIAAMVQPDPAHRPADVPAALHLLGGAASTARPFTRDGDPVDVLRQLPPLPAGWDPIHGPPTRKGRSAPAGRVTLVDGADAMTEELPGPPDTSGEPLEPDGAPPTAAMPAPTPPAATSTVPPATGTPAEPPATLQTAEPPRTAGARTDRKAPDPGRTRRRSATAAASAVVAAVVVGATLLLTAPGGSGGARETVPATGSSTLSAGSTKNDPSTGGRAGTSPTPTAAGAPVTARVGGTCSWQQEGDPLAGTAGSVRCARTGSGDYVWVAAAG